MILRTFCTLFVALRFVVFSVRFVTTLVYFALLKFDVLYGIANVLYCIGRATFCRVFCTFCQSLPAVFSACAYFATKRL